ncbi:glycosyltransferase domain-containing protein [uncultured Roseobacter sp.]|uniref:glycosyltransferase domain-containing protein n=1 Tax=uncultured Roseobacter sp. TaxID=114847 RepID=UPI002637FF7E|nr:glycosyltransferase domain-containing protein [uncultured Roseobacter sp.]
MTTKKNQIVVYGCFFGAPEPFNPTSLGTGEGYDRVLVTDRKDLSVPDGIRLLHQRSDALGPLHESRRAKLMPHLFFPEHTWSIYVDNRASLVSSPAEIIDRISQQLTAPPTPGRYLFRHQTRQFVRDELDTCYQVGLFNEETWRLLHRTFQSVDLPHTPDLTQNTIMIQMAGDVKTDELNALWFELFLRYCRRDQLTLNLAEHIGRQKWTRLDFPMTEVADWPVIRDDQRAREIRSNTVDKPRALSFARILYKRRKNRILRNIVKMKESHGLP